ncbi:DUF4115 domain-containing protein [SAR86 cluster bacterium]|nr:DUF4115 domain-containing protein [SAR86 cluster bacterium]
MKLNWKSQIGEMRSSKGLTIEDCSKKTKIPASFLSSLEIGDFNSFPAEIYSKFHIQTYFNFLEIDPVECLEAYDFYLQGKKINNINELVNVSDISLKTKLLNILEAKNLLPKILSFFIFILFLLLILFARDNSSVDINPDCSEITVDGSCELVSSEDNGFAVLEAEAIKIIDNEIKSAEDKSVKLKLLEEQLINIEVDGESWIVVKDKNEKNLLYELMQTGNYEIKGFSPLIFQIGHSPSVKIFINKKELDFTKAIKSSSKYAHFRFQEGNKIESIKD